LPDSTPDNPPEATNGEYGRLPWGPIAAGILAYFKPADALVYLAIVGHIRRQAGWSCFPSLATLARLTALTRRAVINAVRRLRALGALNVKTGRREGHPNVPNVYELQTDWAPDGERRFTISQDQMVNAGTPDGERRRTKMVNGGSPEERKKKQVRKKAPPKRREPSTSTDHTCQQAIALWCETYKESRGQAADRIDGRTAGRLAKWLRTNSVSIDTWKVRVHLAAGLDGRRPPWPFGEPGELTIDNITRHWAKLGDAQKGKLRGSSTIKPPEGEYSHLCK
jgi:hypothetical protein